MSRDILAEVATITDPTEAKRKYDRAVRHYTPAALTELEQHPVEQQEDSPQVRHAKALYRVVLALTSGITFDRSGLIHHPV